MIALALRLGRLLVLADRWLTRSALDNVTVGFATPDRAPGRYSHCPCCLKYGCTAVHRDPCHVHDTEALDA